MSQEKMHKEEERLDELFRSSLGKLRTEPSAGVWNKLNRSLLWSEIKRFRFSNLPTVFWPAIPAAVIILGVALYFLLNEQEIFPEPPVAEPAEFMEPLPPAPPSLAEVPAPASHPASGVPNPASHSASTVPTPAIQPVMTPEPGALPAEPAPESRISVSPEPEPVGETTGEVFFTGHLTSVQQTPSALFSVPGLYPDISLFEPGLPPVLVPLASPAATRTLPGPSPRPLARSLDLGVNITPEMVFYRNPSSTFKYNYTFDLGIRAHLGRFFLQSGAGFTYSTAIGNFAISYLRNDSVGFYYTVNSYSVTPGSPEVPQFDTKEITVYDSVLHLYDYHTKNRYYYLQIPLSFGYRIINKPRWNLCVEAGLFYSYLLSLREPYPAFYIPESRILDISRTTPERNRHSFGITGGLCAGYAFTRNLYLLVEPTFRYYVQAIEESGAGGARQPYSIGLRAGIWYRLDLKNPSK